MLHGSETWGPNAPELQRLRRNDRAMIRWICGVRPQDEVRSETLLQKLAIDDILVVLRTRRLGWYGHTQRSTSCIKTVQDLQLPGANRRGRPRKTWAECVRNDLDDLGLSAADTADRSAWRSAVRASRLLPTPLNGK